MLIAIIGENCTGKSTLAKKLTEVMPATVYSGKDYLRLEKSPSMAELKFKKLLAGAVNGDSVIYLITEKDHIRLLPEGAVRIVLTEALDVIKARFVARMGGRLPPPLERRLEAQHGMYDCLACDLKLEGDYSLKEVLEKLNLV